MLTPGVSCCSLMARGIPFFIRKESSSLPNIYCLSTRISQHTCSSLTRYYDVLRFHPFTSLHTRHQFLPRWKIFHCVGQSLVLVWASLSLSLYLSSLVIHATMLWLCACHRMWWTLVLCGHFSISCLVGFYLDLSTHKLVKFWSCHFKHICIASQH